MALEAFQNIFSAVESLFNVDGHCAVDMRKWQFIKNSKQPSVLFYYFDSSGPLSPKKQCKHQTFTLYVTVGMGFDFSFQKHDQIFPLSIKALGPTYLFLWTGSSSQDEKQSIFNFLCQFVLCPEYTEKTFKQTFGLSFQGHLSISASKGFGGQLLLGPRSSFLLFKCGCLHSKTTSKIQPKPLNPPPFAK